MAIFKDKWWWLALVKHSEKVLESNSLAMCEVWIIFSLCVRSCPLDALLSTQLFRHVNTRMTINIPPGVFTAFFLGICYSLRCMPWFTAIVLARKWVSLILLLAISSYSCLPALSMWRKASAVTELRCRKEEPCRTMQKWDGGDHFARTEPKQNAWPPMSRCLVSWHSYQL